MLAHTPFSEPVDDAVIARAVAVGQRWISTLFVTGYGPPTPDPSARSTTSAVSAPPAASVLYGTDLGNGEQPLGVNPAELGLLTSAGLGAPELISTVTDPWPRLARAEGIATFVPGPPPAALDDLPDWLATACVVPAEDLETL